MYNVDADLLMFLFTFPLEYRKETYIHKSKAMTRATTANDATKFALQPNINKPTPSMWSMQ